MSRALMAECEPDYLVRMMGAGAADIARVMPEVRDQIPDLEPPRSLEPEQARFRFFDAVTTFMRNIAADRPLVLVLDDLHWADAPSLRLLQFLARELSDSSILVLGTYRDVELGRRHPLSQALADLSRESLVERISLRGCRSTRSAASSRWWRTSSRRPRSCGRSTRRPRATPFSSPKS